MRLETLELGQGPRLPAPLASGPFVASVSPARLQHTTPAWSQRQGRNWECRVSRTSPMSMWWARARKMGVTVAPRGAGQRKRSEQRGWGGLTSVEWKDVGWAKVF